MPHPADRLFATIVLLVALPSLALAQLVNPGFEADDVSAGDLSCATGWTCFNDVFTTAQFPLVRTGTQVLKTYGPFFLAGEGSVARQQLPATAGEVWFGAVHAMNWSGDALQGNDYGFYRIEFLDGAGNPVAGGAPGIDTFDSARIDAGSQQDRWKLLPVITGAAPVGTATVRAAILRIAADGFNGGSIFWDDARLAARGSSTTAFNLSRQTFSGAVVDAGNASHALQGTVGEVGVVGRSQGGGYQMALGFWAGKTTPTAVGIGSDPETPRPRDLDLRAVPNPFNPSTEFRFNLDRGGVVVVRIFNVAGRQVREIDAGALGAGPRSVRWDGTDSAGRTVSSGQYFARVSLDSRMLGSVIKLALLK